MNHPEQSDIAEYREIGLVDLAAFLWFRRFVALSIFLLIVSLGVIYAVLAKDKYEYVSLYQVAGLPEGEYLEDPEVSVMALESRWLPEVVEEKDPGQTGVAVAFTAQKKGGVIRILTEAVADRSEDVHSFHNELLSRLENHQRVLMEEEASQIRDQIALNKELIESLRSSNGGRDSGLSVVLEKQMELRSRLEGLKAGSPLVVARQSIKPAGPGRVFVVAVSIALGVVLGAFFALLAEFLSNVSKRYTIMLQGR